MEAATTSLSGESPLNGKRRFERRTLNNWVMVIGIFMAVVAPVAFLWPDAGLIVAVLLGGCLFYVHFFLLEKRAIGIRCPHCLKYILTNTFWKCGFKECINEQTVEFPFIHQCQHCGNEPKAYQCHHCNNLIFLTQDEDKANYASPINLKDVKPPPEKETVPPSLEKPIEQVRQEALDEENHHIAMTERKIVREKQDQHLESLVARREQERISISEKLRRDAKNHKEHHTELHRSVAQQEKQAYKDFKDNPDMLKAELERIKAWSAEKLRERSGEG